MSATVLACNYNSLGNCSIGLVTCALNNLLEVVLAISTCRGRKVCPIGRFAVAFDQPGERLRHSLADLGSGRQGTVKRSLVGRHKLGRAKFAPNPDFFIAALPTEVPSNRTVSGARAPQVRRARAGHGVYHRTISPTGSSGFSVPVDEFSRIIIEDCPPMRTSTSTAPVCLAARIARATSAWVMVAGRRGIVGHGP